MDYNAAIGCGLFLFFLIFACAFTFQRLRWKHRKRLGKTDLGFYPTFSSLGHALQNIQQFAQPQVALSMREEDTEDDEDAEEIEKDGIQHLHRQLKRIRSGDGIERLTVLLRFWRP